MEGAGPHVCSGCRCPDGVRILVNEACLTFWWFVQNGAAIATFIGLGVTIVLLIGGYRLRRSFLQRARLPSIVSTLQSSIEAIGEALKTWDTDKGIVITQFSTVRGVLQSVGRKVSRDERQRLKRFLRQLQPSFSRRSLSEMSESQAWNLYTELCALTERLSQLQEDVRWS